MTSESDAEFLDSMEQWVIGSLVFKAEHRKRLFALARRGAAMQWRPIEAAPKDGTPLLLLWPDAAEKMAVMWWDGYCEGWMGYYDGINPGQMPPTHWMPLPPPPAGEQE